MRDFARPTVVVSRCLGFDACRYDGRTVPSRFTGALSRHAEVRTVCPEVEIGLGTPRDTIRIVKIDGALRLEQPASERDLTDEMVAFGERYLDGLGAVDGFVLKSRSPSCGVRDAEIRAPAAEGRTLGRGPGFFAAAVLDRYPLAAVEDEGRLADRRIRERFLTRLFAIADFRRARRGGSLAKLVDFHSRHEPLLTAPGRKETRILGSIVDNLEKRPLDEVWALYLDHLEKALAHPAWSDGPDREIHFEPYPEDLARATDSCNDGESEGARPRQE